LDSDTRFRLLETAVTFLRIDGVRFVKPGVPVRDAYGILPTETPQPTSETSRSPSGSFSDRPDISPKEFMLDKEPKSDIEKVACLAFYLTHYRNLAHFKTLDVSKLNTEAAQVKFSNPAMAVDNATKLGFLVPASKGMKQIGALGEQFVRALPDREAAKLVRAKIRPRRNRKSGKPATGGADENEES
jgi:hypothetical protein